MGKMFQENDSAQEKCWLYQVPAGKVVPTWARRNSANPSPASGGMWRMESASRPPEVGVARVPGNGSRTVLTAPG